RPPVDIVGWLARVCVDDRAVIGDVVAAAIGFEGFVKDRVITNLFDAPVTDPVTKIAPLVALEEFVGQQPFGLLPIVLGQLAARTELGGRQPGGRDRRGHTEEADEACAPDSDAAYRSRS